MNPDPPVISLQKVRGHFSAELSFTIPDFTVTQGEQIALLGKSGSGKSTLLNLLSGMMGATDGSILLHEQELVGLSEVQRDRVRRNHIGMIFQTYQLLPEFTVLENVLMGAFFSDQQSPQNKIKALDLLSEVGLDGLSQRRASALSVGQQQRVAIARALIKSPPIILADEPTGALDQETGSSICDLIQRLARESQSALIFVTHDQQLAQRFPKQLQVSDLLHWNTSQQKSA